jgi:hypothetical protein
MLDYLRGRGSGRKLRLFGVACCRRGWEFLGDADRTAVEVSERYADKLARKAELRAAHNALEYWDPAERLCCALLGGKTSNAFWLVAHRMAGLMGDRSSDPQGAAGERARKAEHAAQRELLAEVFGNPFRPIVLPPGWLAWSDGLLPRMAQVLYEERNLPRGTLDTARMGVLADALEEAAFTDASILDHCRGGGEHVRGCWVIDALLCRK